ncbi:MAG: DNA mismatch repair endonuclease MutL, partial [Anaerovoracaceae bacterium]
MIKILDKSVADKIAAGEVVDRPSSIVKELVENAIDAGATSIIAEIKNGGKSYIRITDNGSGIPQEETELAFHRHATSKITQAEDLDALETLGFRGEALASIAAVSRTELITKTKTSKTGTRLYISGGEITDKSSIGAEEGTTLIVRDLFYNVPARLKFMKSDSTESGLILNFMSQIALAYPQIKIRMISNNNILFNTNGKGDRLHTIATLSGKSQSQHLIPIFGQKDYLTLTGYVSGPGESKSNRKSQVFFVNGRVIHSKVLEKGIAHAYRDKLFEGRHPIVYLFLEVSGSTVDVNIHPNKKEIRFFNEDFVRDFLCETIRAALSGK